MDRNARHLRGVRCRDLASFFAMSGRLRLTVEGRVGKGVMDTPGQWVGRQLRIRTRKRLYVVTLALYGKETEAMLRDLIPSKSFEIKTSVEEDYTSGRGKVIQGCYVSTFVQGAFLHLCPPSPKRQIRGNRIWETQDLLWGLLISRACSDCIVVLSGVHENA